MLEIKGHRPLERGLQGQPPGLKRRGYSHAEPSLTLVPGYGLREFNSPLGVPSTAQGIRNPKANITRKTIRPLDFILRAGGTVVTGVSLTLYTHSDGCVPQELPWVLSAAVSSAGNSGEDSDHTIQSVAGSFLPLCKSVRTRKGIEGLGAGGVRKPLGNTLGDPESPSIGEQWGRGKEGQTGHYKGTC